MENVIHCIDGGGTVQYIVHVYSIVTLALDSKHSTSLPNLLFVSSRVSVAQLNVLGFGDRPESLKLNGSFVNEERSESRFQKVCSYRK